MSAVIALDLLGRASCRCMQPAGPSCSCRVLKLGGSRIVEREAEPDRFGLLSVTQVEQGVRQAMSSCPAALSTLIDGRSTAVNTDQNISFTNEGHTAVHYQEAGNVLQR